MVESILLGIFIVVGLELLACQIWFSIEELRRWSKIKFVKVPTKPLPPMIK